MSQSAVRLFPQDNNRLSFLTHPVTTMFGIIDRYVANQVENGSFDLPYHHTERATLSLFAGAVWRSHPDNFVLEEFGTDKAWGSVGYRGRRDIWFTASGHSCSGEAKQQHVNLAGGSTGVDTTLSTLEVETTAAVHALSDAPTPRRPERALGILFVTPFVLRSRITKASNGLSRRQQELESRLPAWHVDKRFHVLWASYLRPELLAEAGCYEWYNGQIGSCPSLETLVCTPA